MSLDYSSFTDEKLMEHYQEGEKLAFEELYKRHSQLAYGYLIKKTMDNAAAQDILQTVFLKVHQHRWKYDKNLPFLPWFFVIMKNTLNDFFKTKKDIPTEKIENQAAYEISESNFQDIIVNLPPRYQQALQMRYAEDLDFDQIAKSLKTSEVNVRKIISRAIQELKETLGRTKK